MSKRERLIISGILLAVAVMVGFDLVTDSREGVIGIHVVTEGFVGFLALCGVFYILKDSFQTKTRLEQEKRNFDQFKLEAEVWRSESKKYIEGLALAIDQQLNKWKLTAAEKEVAFLLLKGFSSKEIAEIRQTSEKTARAQSMAVYAKSGLDGRAGLSAYFLEDLLVPSFEDASKVKVDNPGSNSAGT